MKKVIIFNILFILVILLVGCTQREKEPPFEIFEWEPTLGLGRNNELYTLYDNTFSEEKFKVKPVAALQDGKRSDFMMGVDASFIKKVLDLGGKYYNEEGVEQDVFEIMALNGVNYLRVRVWNDPNSPIGIRGGGDLTLENALWIAQKARRVNMRIILNLHYSDNWADPEKQYKPYAWELLNFQELTEAVKTFT